MTHALRMRLAAFAVHLACSALIGSSVFTLLYWAWHPSPLFDLAGGKALLGLLVGCDVVLGPLLTLIIFNIAKPRRELKRDIALIALVQLAALFYGTHTMYVARPVYIVYNGGQFNVVLANMLDPQHAKKSRAEVPAISLWGPQWVGSREPADLQVRNAILFAAVEGRADLYQMPDFYVPYADIQREVAGHALTVPEFVKRNGGNAAALNAMLAECDAHGRPCGLLPLVLKHTYAIAVVDRESGKVIASYRQPED